MIGNFDKNIGNDVLILNADYSLMSVSPLSTIGWKDAIRLTWLDQIDVLEEYPDWVVHSPTVTMRVPSVIVSRHYVKPSFAVKFTKLTLCVRDDFKCQYCLKPFEYRQLTMEHVTPRCRGGKTNFTNVCMACGSCNTKKGNKLNVKPVKEPYKPTYGELATKARKTPITIPDASWLPYLGWPPKLITIKKRQNI